MDYNVRYVSSISDETLGFRQKGQLEITADTLHITGRRPYLIIERFMTYSIYACTAILLVLWLADTQLNVVLGCAGYWVALGVTLAVIVLPLPLTRGKKGSVVFPLTQLRQVIYHDTNITVFVSSDNGEESIITMHTVTSSGAQEIAIALEKHEPFATPVSFGYDAKPEMLAQKGKGMLSLNDQQLAFSSLCRWNDPLTPKTNIWLLLLILFPMNLTEHILRAANISTAITSAIVVVIAIYAVFYSYILYLKRRRYPYTYTFDQVMTIIPQGGIMLLKIREASGCIRDILFRLTDLTQEPTLLAELQGRMSPATE